MVDTFAGGKIRSGVPAQEVSLTQLAGIAFDPSGSLVLCDQTSNVIRRIRPDGTIETLAGNGTTGFTGDGGPALNAALNQPAFPRFDAQSNLYFADTSNYRIRRVDSKGIITTIAGSGVPFQTGMDLEGPALSRSIGTIGDMAVDPSGIVYFALASNTGVIRRVAPGGRMEIFAGIPHSDCPYCTDGDNGPALAARIAPGFLAADGKGNVYLTESGSVSGTHIRRIGPDGIITRFAGYGPVPINGTTVDDDARPALNIFISGVGGMAADGAGNLYYIDPAFTSPSPSPRIRRIDTNGIVNTIAGGPAYSASSDGSPLLTAINPFSIAADARGNVAFTDSLPATPFSVGVVREHRAQAHVGQRPMDRRERPSRSLVLKVLGEVVARGHRELAVLIRDDRPVMSDRRGRLVDDLAARLRAGAGTGPRPPCRETGSRRTHRAPRTRPARRASRRRTPTPPPGGCRSAASSCARPSARSPP